MAQRITVDGVFPTAGSASSVTATSAASAAVRLDDHGVRIGPADQIRDTRGLRRAEHVGPDLRALRFHEPAQRVLTRLAERGEIERHRPRAGREPRLGERLGDGALVHDLSSEHGDVAEAVLADHLPRG
ncbi:hypothetical protein [Sorangium sp. So ce1151]|uniref:hypothetical protein n=1 Tax=Sorangium sp. So ce1151 TaxID=3133332 RepID=UPI003F5EBF2A